MLIFDIQVINLQYLVQSVELIPSIFKKVVEGPLPEINVPNTPHSDRYAQGRTEYPPET